METGVEPTVVWNSVLMAVLAMDSVKETNACVRKGRFLRYNTLEIAHSSIRNFI